MNKFMIKFKKVIAVSALVLVTACTIVPTVQAANSIGKIGARKHSSSGYRSYTQITGVDDRGISLYVTAAAQMQGGRWTNYGTGVASVYSDYFVAKTDAYHAYGIGKGVIDNSTLWKEN